MDTTLLRMIPMNELELEILRRKEQQRSTRPKLLENPDLSKLQELCEEYINGVEYYVGSGDKEDEPDQCDFDNSASEIIFSVLYGNSVFDYIDNLYDSLKRKNRGGESR